ncbi:salicylate hydroxylase [Apiospora rasikravindrae]|uniref:Salicylate hydroxylase n=1 Tax=Apiospora rasikravindrae TaxID=990691 RepID=A0ABR1UDE8_9PEZI
MALNGTTIPVVDATKSNPLVHDYPEPLKIAVVGAGIGGLSAAIALRRQGHVVDLYEQSSLASETGAAVHLAPNSNGLLRRWGIYAEKFGACNTTKVVEFAHTGGLIKEIDLTMPNKMWQHPWQLVHRVALHDNLMAAATAKDVPGPPATLYTSSKVTGVDPDASTLTFADGSTRTADLIIGADGIYSKTRKAISGSETKLFGSGKAAFRFLLQRQAALEDPVTKPIVDRVDSLCMWFSDDRRVVMYPCNNNDTLNFVLIHPAELSHASPSDGKFPSIYDTEWNKQGSLEQVLKVYKDFDPALKQLISKVSPEELKVWQLLDMDKLPSWVRGSVALLGDAAHPFTPHQGQGAGQAMEDAAALAVVLPKGTAPKDVPERLRLYEKIRYDRAHNIQEYSRQSGKDWVNGVPQIDVMKYTAYNFGHDEIDHSTRVFNEWLSSRKPDLYRRMPLGFGPAPGPRQDVYGRPQPGLDQSRFVTTTVKFETSRTYLESLFPTPAFRFLSPATVCVASVAVTTLDGMAWLGGGGYSHCGLYLHGVGYFPKAGPPVVGTYLPVLFENLTDAIITGRDELGFNKTFCDIDIDRGSGGDGTSYNARCSWLGAKFMEITLDDLQQEESNAAAEKEGSDILTYKYIPATGQPGKADAEYACVVPHAEEAKVAARTVKSRATTNKAILKFDAGSWQTLPTLHHVASVLAGIPVYRVVEATVVEGTGVPDVSSCRRIE